MSDAPITSYLDAARQGRTSLLSFILSLAVIFFFWQILGALPLSFFLIVEGGLAPNAPSLEGLFSRQPFAAFLLVMLSFVFFVLGLWLALRLVHRRKLRTLISADGSVRWRRLFQGFAVWGGLAAVQSLLEAWLYPGRYVWAFDPGRFFVFLIPMLLLFPIQTSAEEFLFRGYLLQGLGLKLRNPLLLSLISGLLFALPHLGNPEVSVNFWALTSYYFLTGVFLAYITLKDQRLELALGMHAANNLFTALFASYTVSAVSTPALFTVMELDAGYALLAFLASVAIFYFVCFPGSFRRPA